MRTRSDQGHTRNKRAAWPDNNNNKKSESGAKKKQHIKKKQRRGGGVGNKESEWMRGGKTYGREGLNLARRGGGDVSFTTGSGARAGAAGGDATFQARDGSRVGGRGASGDRGIEFRVEEGGGRGGGGGAIELEEGAALELRARLDLCEVELAFVRAHLFPSAHLDGGSGGGAWDAGGACLGSRRLTARSAKPCTRTQLPPDHPTLAT